MSTALRRQYCAGSPLKKEKIERKYLPRRQYCAGSLFKKTETEKENVYRAVNIALVHFKKKKKEKRKCLPRRQYCAGGKDAQLYERRYIEYIIRRYIEYIINKKNTTLYRVYNK